MKENRNKHIQILAQKIVKLEKEVALGKNVQENQSKIQNIVDSLSIEEMLEIDDYITRKKLLTK